MNSDSHDLVAINARMRELLNQEFEGQSVDHYVTREDNPELLDLFFQSILAEMAESEKNNPLG